MQHIIRHKEWLYTVNVLRTRGKFGRFHFLEERDFSGTAYLDLIFNSHHDTPPLGISIFMPLEDTLCTMRSSHADASSPSPIRNYLNYLKQEITLIGKITPKEREVSYLYLHRGLFKALSASEITELIYHLNKSFKLSKDKRRQFVIELEELPAEDDVALLNGLGINQVSLGNSTVEWTPSTLDMLKNKIQLLKRYQFDSNSIRFIFNNEAPSLSEKRLNMLLTLQPECIYAVDNNLIDPVLSRHFNANNTLPDSLGSILENGHYHLQNRVEYCLEPDHANIPGDIIGIGLGATSLIGRHFAHNHDQLDQYYVKLGENELPFYFGGVVRNID